MTCPLCVLEHRTNVYYECPEYIILDCLSCKIPMIVVKEHTMHPDQVLVEEMKGRAQRLFGPQIRYGKVQRTIPDHWHWHVLNHKPRPGQNE